MTRFHESLKSFPIRFFKTKEGIEYESGFTLGASKDLTSALKKFTEKSFIEDLLFFYDDVIDVQIGHFEPGYGKKKGKEYLGQLILKLKLSDGPLTQSNHSATYLNKHRDEIPQHLKYIKKSKEEKRKQDQIQKIQDKIKSIYQKIRRKFLNEMFYPDKTFHELICNYCGRSIPIGNYYEEWRGKNYHLECIWDMLLNKQEENGYEEARKFFFSLKKLIGRWPSTGFDVQDDYVFDLDLIEHNDRVNK